MARCNSVVAETVLSDLDPASRARARSVELLSGASIADAAHIDIVTKPETSL